VGVALDAMRLVGVPTSNPVGGDPTRLRVQPGDRTRSDLWERLRRRDTFAMPPFSTALVDPLGAELVGAWIEALPGN